MRIPPLFANIATQRIPGGLYPFAIARVMVVPLQAAEVVAAGAPVVLVVPADTKIK